ncbi:hypothetical protein ABZ353_10870 [Streptomyces niveus]|uniref:hypothetical protein n=1 Tax=Streptomyces niveus TaxID=193462 RepID=UPI0033EAD568
MVEFWPEIKVDLDSLARQLATQVTNESLVEFIKDLDSVAEWDFTVKLRDYFNGLDYPEEVN